MPPFLRSKSLHLYLLQQLLNVLPDTRATYNHCYLGNDNPRGAAPSGLCSWLHSVCSEGTGSLRSAFLGRQAAGDAHTPGALPSTRDTVTEIRAGPTLVK